jgi:hypothetical protein
MVEQAAARLLRSTLCDFFFSLWLRSQLQAISNWPRRVLFQTFQVNRTQSNREADRSDGRFESNLDQSHKRMQVALALSKTIPLDRLKATLHHAATALKKRSFRS